MSNVARKDFNGLSQWISRGSELLPPSAMSLVMDIVRRHLLSNRDAIDSALSQLDGDNRGVLQSDVPRIPRMVHGGVPHRVLAFVSTHPNASAADVVAGLKDTSTMSVYTALYKLSREGGPLAKAGRRSEFTYSVKVVATPTTE